MNQVVVWLIWISTHALATHTAAVWQRKHTATDGRGTANWELPAMYGTCQPGIMHDVTSGFMHDGQVKEHEQMLQTKMGP